MRYFDVFNGDADGICALHQLRLADPLDSTLVTGLKRDIALLGSVPAGDGDVVLVLDICARPHRDALQAPSTAAPSTTSTTTSRATCRKHPRCTRCSTTPASPARARSCEPLSSRTFAIWAAVGAFGDAF
jgi:hypothetical protein